MRRIILSILLFAFPAIALAAPFTVGRIPKATSGTYLTDSSIYEISAGNAGIAGTFYATTYYGDGSKLTGISAGSVDLSSVDQGIYPETDSAYQIGSASKAWTAVFSDKVSIGTTATSNALEVGGNSAAYSAYTCTGTNCYSGSYYYANGHDTWELGVGGAANILYFYNTTNGVTTFKLDHSNNATFIGSVTASSFIGGTGDTAVGGALTVTGTTQSGGYKSSDGTAGMTGSCASTTTLTVKNGLIVGCS